MKFNYFFWCVAAIEAIVIGLLVFFLISAIGEVRDRGLRDVGMQLWCGQDVACLEEDK